jgi:LmeA-like phospholipid-binding
MQDEQRLEQQAVNKVAEMQMSSQTDLWKLIQGQADGVSFSGQGLVVQKDIRLEELVLQTDKIDINLFSAIFGEIELNQPVKSIARVVLKEADINRALTSNYIGSKMPTFDLNVDGEIVSLKPQEIQIFLPGDGKIKCNGTVSIHEKGNTNELSFTALVRPRTQTQPIMLESFTCTEGDGISLEIVTALLQKVKELVNLPYIQLEGIALQIKSMEVQKGSIKTWVEAYIKQIPTM